MTKLFSLLTFISIFSLSCHSEKPRNIETPPRLTLTEDLIQQNVKYSEIVKDCEFIPLETTNESLIGQIDKIILHNNQYYVFDSRKASSIFVFSLNGKFLWKLSKQGKGPGEYLEPADFSFEPGTNNLVVLNMMELLFYDDKNGAYLKTLKLPIFAYKFDYSSDDYISFVNGDHDFDLVITDAKGNKVNSFFEYIKETKLILNNPFIRSGKSDLLFLTNLDYTIYKIIGNQIFPHIRIDFGKDMYSPNDLNLLKEDKANVNIFYHISSYYESTNKIFIHYWYKKVLYFSISDKTTKKTLIFDYYKIENDVTFTKLLPRIMTTSSHFWRQMSYLPALRLKCFLVHSFMKN